MCKNKAKPCYLEKQTYFCMVLIYFTLCSKFYNKLSARHLFTYTCTSTKPTFYDFNYDTTKGKHKYAAEYYKNAIHDIAVWHTHNGVTKHLRLGEGNSKKSLNVYIVQPLIWILMLMALSMNTRHSLALEAEITQYCPWKEVGLLHVGLRFTRRFCMGICLKPPTNDCKRIIHKLNFIDSL